MERYIAAIEIGSSKIKGAVARVDSDTDRISVVAVATTPLLDAVRYGRVQNVQEVSSAVNEIIRRLENAPLVAPRKIKQVFIGTGGRSFATIEASSQARFPNEIQITDDTIERLVRDATYDVGTSKAIVKTLPRRFFVGNAEVKNPVGSYAQELRGEFTVIVCSRENKVNIDRLTLQGAGQPGRRYIAQVLAMGEMVLTPSERQLGVALIDFGAETSTIVVYKDETLRFISTVPLGGRNITRDISMAVNTTEDRAEYLKLTIDRGASDPESRKIDNYVNARAGEIIANAIYQLKQAGYKASDLPAGIVVAGGASQLPGFVEMLESQSQMQVRQADVDRVIEIETEEANRIGDLDVIALLRYAGLHTSDNCLTEVEKPAVKEPVVKVTAEEDDDNEELEFVVNDKVNRTGRRVVAEDDDDLLKDDDDDDEAEVMHKHVKSKKHTVKQPEPKKEEPEETDDDEKDGDDENKRSWIDRMKDLGVKIFGAAPDEEF